MKTAISIDDKLFTSVENAAKKMGITRSKLFSNAVEEYIVHHNSKHITSQLDQIYSDKKNNLDKNIEKAQFSSIDFSEW